MSKTNPTAIKFKYDPDKNQPPRHFPGIPTADLTVAAVLRLQKYQYETVLKAGFYVDVMPAWLPPYAIGPQADEGNGATVANEVNNETKAAVAPTPKKPKKGSK